MALTIGNIGEEMNLLIKQGATFGPVIFTMTDSTGTPINLLGCTIRGQIRKTRQSNAVAAQLNCQIVDATAGKFLIHLSWETTAMMKAAEDPRSPENVYVWDLEMQDTGGKVTPLYYGIATIFPEVTKG